MRRSPLARPGVDVREGDVILDDRRRATFSPPDLGALLRNKAGRQVLLRVKPAKDGKTERATCIVKPMTPAKRRAALRRVGVHAAAARSSRPAAARSATSTCAPWGRATSTQWARDYYPVFDRQGLIIDVRHNRGGNIDSWVLGKLLRKAWFYWQPRVGRPELEHAVRLPRPHRGAVRRAHGSRRRGVRGRVPAARARQGDRHAHLGRRDLAEPSATSLVDSGIATAAETGVYGPEGKWLIEGHGVEPDIVVDNLPHATFNGSDAQLDAAIKHLQELIREKPVTAPAAPPYPDKSFRR